MDYFGIALFEKKDGFELHQLEGFLRQFRSEEAIQQLSTSIQLKLEEIRIHQEEDIWRYSILPFEDSMLRIYTLYTYSLDAYKRDGYVAASIAFNEKQLPPVTIYSSLKKLIRWPQMYGASLDLDIAEELFFYTPGIHHQGKGQALMQLNHNRKAEVIQWFEEVGILQPVRYDSIFAVTGDKTISTIDSSKFSFLGRDFFPLETPNDSSIPKAQPPSYEYVNGNSISDQFESEGEERWKRKSPATGKKEKSGKRSFLSWFGR